MYIYADATFAGLAGVSAVDAGGPTPIDSIDQWQYISGEVPTSPRSEMVYEHRKFNNDTEYTGAVRREQWKLVLSREHAAGWFGHFSPNASYANGTGSKVYDAVGPCGPDRPCLCVQLCIDFNRWLPEDFSRLHRYA